MFEQNNTDRNPFASTNANNALWSLSAQNSANNTSRGGSSSVNSPQNTYNTPTLPPSSVINLSNSSDVVIGPMTQYQGPVTIYQYMDATVEARSMQANAINSSRTTTSTTVSQRVTFTSKLLILLLILVIVVVGIILYVELMRPKSDAHAIYFSNNYEHDAFPNLGDGHLVVERDQWGASENAKNLTIPLKHPIPYVMITHIGVQSQPCYNIYKCSIKMRSIQDAAIAEKGLPDISSNFYVSGDGYIYVGRGWHWANTYADRTLAITFMGDYVRHKPEKRQVEATKYLLAHALTNKYIALDYKLVAHNQTRKSKSPGAYVYSIIKKWPHFYPCGEENYPVCGSELGMAPYPWEANA
uniref:Peptidoglycan recognition protein family domain-containing protein n=1 Tax=Glossina morsitans morsitans TaxID=37546 RepID=A0A1B0FQA6_GLOMM